MVYKRKLLNNFPVFPFSHATYSLTLPEIYEYENILLKIFAKRNAFSVEI